MARYWILEGHEPKPSTLSGWAVWYENTNRTVRRDEFVCADDTPGTITTAFLGIGHNPVNVEPPLLFATMIFCAGHPRDGEMERYATWDEAVAGHERMLKGIHDGATER